MKSKIKDFIKRHAPLSLANFLRSFYMKTILLIKGTRKRHLYLGFPLEIYIGDPDSLEWYDCDWAARNEIELLRKNKLKAGARVFNIGAHQCVVALILARIVGDGGKVVAVEMDAHHVNLARINKQNNHAPCLEIIHAAASEKAKAVFMDGGCVQESPARRGMTKIDSLCVDDLSVRYGPPSVLYIDVEGYECQVFRGAKDTLRHYPDCCIEVHAGCGIEDYNGSIEELVSYFPETRYNLYMAEAIDACRFVPYQPRCEITKGKFYLVALCNKRPDNPR